MSWDITSKTLLKECPQDFVLYFVPEAEYVGMRETQFQTRPDGPVDPREIRADGVMEVEYRGKPFLLHIEWQAKKDPKMGVRLRGYNHEADALHELSALAI